MAAMIICVGSPMCPPRPCAHIRSLCADIFIVCISEKGMPKNGFAEFLFIKKHRKLWNWMKNWARRCFSMPLPVPLEIKENLLSLINAANLSRQFHGGGAKSGLCRLNTDLEWTHCSYFSQIFLWALPLPRFFRTLQRKVVTNFAGYARLKEPGISHAKMLSCMPDRIWYRGHFLDERYFLHLRPLLQDHFRLKNSLNMSSWNILKKISSCVSVAVSLPSETEISDQMQKYYQDSVQYICRCSRAHFFIFGKNHHILGLDSSLYTLISSGGKQRAYIDLELMKNCTHHIIGESRLAWWGAWLADREEKIVIAPEKFSSGFVKECDLPAGWIRM